VRVAPVALFAIACAAGDKDSAGDPACTGALLDTASFQVTFSPDIATVGTLALTVDGPADVTITLRADGAPDVTPPTWEGLDGPVELPLYGMRPDTTYTATVRAASGDTCEDADTPVVTGSLPAFLPATTLLDDGALGGGYALTGWIDNEAADNTGALIVDQGGAIVWAWVSPDGVAAHAIWATNSTDVLVRADDRAQPGNSRVYRVAMTGDVVEEHLLANGHHNLGLAPDISFAFLRAVSVEVDGEDVTGDEVVELGVDGTERVVWNAFDCMPEIEHHQAWNVDTAPIDGRDWTHTNGISYCAADDTWMLSFYYLREVHKVRRSDCSDVWMIDGDGSSGRGYALSEESFGPQHSPHCTDDGVVFFDNSTADGISRGVALEIDTDTASATRRWAAPHPDDGQTSLLGGAEPTADGGALLSWGTLGELSVNDADGAIGWRVAVDHSTLGSVSRRSTLYGE
jgi:hypothetical protein